jgi:WXG100 family type VII secretion target
MAPLFVVVYEELTKIASAFDREADRLRQSFQQVVRTVEVLRGGDWVGQGAAAFFREMDSDVIPAMKALPSALEAAGRTTRDIAQNTKDAEDEIVRLFAGLFGPGSAAAIAAAVGAGMGQALGAAAGAAGGAAQAVAQAATTQTPGEGADFRAANPLLARDPGGLFSDGYMRSLIGLRTRGAGGALGNAMSGLANASSPAEADRYLARIAELRGRPLDDIRAEYGRFQALRAQRDAATAAGAEQVPELSSAHPFFTGSNTQLRYGQVVGDAFGVDPVFGAMLNPTGGLVGLGNAALAGDDTAVGYHGVVHDAAGYLRTYHNAGPGYDYLGREGRDTLSALSGQREGIRYWSDTLGGPSPVSAPAEWVMRGFVGGVDVASSVFDGIKGVF